MNYHKLTNHLSELSSMVFDRLCKTETAFDHVYNAQYPSFYASDTDPETYWITRGLTSCNAYIADELDKDLNRIKRKENKDKGVARTTLVSKSLKLKLPRDLAWTVAEFAIPKTYRASSYRIIYNVKKCPSKLIQ
jgi:hypothetical protein